jgi:tight adherence protein B
MISIVTFVLVLAITFGIAAYFIGESRSQKLIDKRLQRIRLSKAEVNSSQAQVENLLKANRDSSFGWLDEMLEEIQLMKMLETRIMQADVKISVVALLLASAGLAVLGFFVVNLLVSMLAVQILAGLVLGAVPFIVISFLRARRVSAFNAALPEVIDMMARALRAGHSMVSSIGVVAEQSMEPARSEFLDIFNQQNFGLPLRDALTQMLEHVPSQDLRVLVTGILVQKETGGNLTEILDRTAHVIRERLRIQGEIRTHTAQGRMTGYILCALPVVLLIVINFANPGYSAVLFNSQIGHILLYVGMFLLTCGGLIIRAIINGIEV